MRTDAGDGISATSEDAFKDLRCAGARCGLFPGLLRPATLEFGGFIETLGIEVENFCHRHWRRVRFCVFSSRSAEVGALSACRATIKDVLAFNISTSSHRWRNATLLCGGNAIFFWQLRYPIVLLASPALNELLGFALGLGLPWLTFVAIVRIGRWWSTAVAIAAIAPLLFYTFLFVLGALMTGFSYKNGHDLSFDRFAETLWKGSDVRFYRTNGGATTDYGVVIRQERTLFPGVLLVRRIDEFYPCYSLDAFSTEDGITVTDNISNCTSFPDQLRKYRLKPFVYF